MVTKCRPHTTNIQEWVYAKIIAKVKSIHVLTYEIKGKRRKLNGRHNVRYKYSQLLFIIY